MEMSNCLFVGYLNFSAVVKIFVMFLNEGIKIYFRMIYALCFMVKDDILKVFNIYYILLFLKIFKIYKFFYRTMFIIIYINYYIKLLINRIKTHHI